MRRWSLRFRILFLTLCVEVVTLLAFTAVAYYRSRSELLDALDDDLRKECATLARLVDAGMNGDPSGADGMTQVTARIVRLSRHDLYQITFSDGQVIAKSPRLGDDLLDLPHGIGDSLEPGKSRGFDFAWDGDVYRGRLMRAGSDDKSATTDTLVSNGTNVQKPREFFVLLAQPSEVLDNRLNDLLIYITAIGATALLVSAIALWIVARWGISPVTRLSSEVESVAPPHLSYRVNADRLPRDLRALGVSINGFIERLEKAFAHEKQFVADASHELGTPIALLKSNIQSALLGPPEPAADRRSLQELLNDVERLEHLSNSLLALSEAEAAGGDLASREKIALRPYLESLVVQFGHSADQRGVSLEVEGRENAVVRANRTVLDRILANLIENAIKYNRPGGKARLSVHREAMSVEIWVADDGPGVPAADVPNLFERFFRVDKSRSRERGGAGLGLAIAKSLCESQGAEISYRPGKKCGSIFIVRFPLVASANRA
jgi:signal transduction histidine kinase